MLTKSIIDLLVLDSQTIQAVSFSLLRPCSTEPTAPAFLGVSQSSGNSSL